MPPIAQLSFERSFIVLKKPNAPMNVNKTPINLKEFTPLNRSNQKYINTLYNGGWNVEQIRIYIFVLPSAFTCTPSGKTPRYLE